MEPLTVCFIIFFIHTGCNEPHALGMESRDIGNDQITASSYLSNHNGEFLPYKARLNNNECWTTFTDQADSWIQVDLLRLTVVTGIITQGSSPPWTEWVTSLQIQYGITEDTLMFISENGQPKVIFFRFF